MEIDNRYVDFFKYNILCTRVFLHVSRAMPLLCVPYMWPRHNHRSQGTPPTHTHTHIDIHKMDFASCTSTSIMQHVGLLCNDPTTTCHEHHQTTIRKRSKTASTKLELAGPSLGFVCTQAVGKKSRCLLHTLKVGQFVLHWFAGMLIS